MFQSYVSTTLRLMVRNKGSTLVSIGGLALGMCCSLFIILYIQFELSHDRFHHKHDLIYRVLLKGEKLNGEIEYRSSIVHELADKLAGDFVQYDSSESLQPSIRKKNLQETRQDKSFERMYPQLNYFEPTGSNYITNIVRLIPQTGYVKYKQRAFEEDFFCFTGESTQVAAVVQLYICRIWRGKKKTSSLLASDNHQRPYTME